MRYGRILPGKFIARPNRFIAQVKVEGETVVAHVKNTGRCRELLVPGAVVYLEESTNPARKTAYDLIAVEKERRGSSPLLINMDAQAPNRVFREWVEAGNFQKGLTLLRPETTWGKSRFDFYWENADAGRRGFVEVKGVTLEEAGTVRFPDAPTERGVKHVEELMACRREGFEAALCFVIQMEEAERFSPNDKTHLAFGEALRRAKRAGVELMALRCAVTPDSLRLLSAPVEIWL